MATKYEVIEIDHAEITVDVSLLGKTEEMFFNATQMAKPFKKDVREFLRSAPVREDGVKFSELKSGKVK